MQMRAGRKAGVAGERNNLAFPDVGAWLDLLTYLLEVRIRGLEAIVLDADMVAIAGHWARLLNFTIRRGAHWRTHGRTEVDPRMEPPYVQDRMEAHAERGGHRRAPDRWEYSADARR